MDVQKEISRIRDEIKIRAKRMAWLRSHKAQLEQLPEGKLFSGYAFDFDNLSHADTIKVIRTLGGKWTKTPTAGVEVGRIDYQTQIDGVQVRCWAGHPPPSCRVVEVEEIVPAVPARVIKVKKMICTGAAEPVAVAIARSNAPLNGGSK